MSKAVKVALISGIFLIVSTAIGAIIALLGNSASSNVNVKGGINCQQSSCEGNVVGAQSSGASSPSAPSQGSTH